MHTTSSRAFAVSICLSSLALNQGCGSAEPDHLGSVEENEQALRAYVPVIPEAVAVPAGNKLSFFLFGDGVQIYDCKAGADGTPAWVFRAPQAQLYGLFGFTVGKHYAGPTWEGFDGSTVVGTRVAGATVDASSIPWLLLRDTGHSGSGFMTNVSYVQRLFTHGGNAPATGCDADHLGAEADVDYTAIYTYYRATGAATDGGL